MALEVIVGLDVVYLILMSGSQRRLLLMIDLSLAHSFSILSISACIAATLRLASASWFARFSAFCWTASCLARVSFCFSKAWSWRLRVVNSSWLDPEGSVTSGVPLGGWLSFGGGCVEGFSLMVWEPFWVSSTGGSVGFLFVCAIEGWFTS